MKNLKNLSSVVAIIVVLSFAVGSIAYLFSGNAGTVMENVKIENFNSNNSAPAESLGSVVSPWSIAPYTCDNNECTWIKRGSCADGTVDLLSIANPWGVTASTTVVDMIRIRIDGVSTSTGIITCGAATTANGTPTYDLMTTGSIATSTGLGCIMENGLLTADNGNSKCPDGGSIQKISLTQMYPYFNCEVSGAMTGGFTSGNNTWDCEYVVRFKQMR